MNRNEHKTESENYLDLAVESGVNSAHKFNREQSEYYLRMAQVHALLAQVPDKGPPFEGSIDLSNNCPEIPGIVEDEEDVRP